MSNSKLYQKFSTDKNAEANGVLYTVPGLFRVRLARMSSENKKFKQKVNELMKPYRKIPIEDIPENKLKEINMKVYCETVILPGTWQTWVVDEESTEGGKWVDGIEAEDGIIPATSENYRKVLTDLHDVYTHLITEAASPDIYRKEALEAAAKN